MTNPILTAAVGTFFDGTTVRTLGVSSAEYHDPALASALERGTFLPVLLADKVEWEESIRFHPQGGSPDAQVSNLPLIATGGTFDAWADYLVAGHSWTVKRGRPDQAWADWELVFEAIGQGIEWRGRKEMVIRLRDRFAALSEPVSQIVFDDSVANDRYRNRRAPAVFGDVLQVGALVIDPAFFRVYAASNLGIIRRVTEGGRPTTNWIDVDNGYQVLQSTVQDALPISADIGGPPLPDTELEDLLADIGGFSAWTSGDPDGWTVTETPPDSEISEDAVNGGALVKSTLATSSAGADLNAGSAQRTYFGDVIGTAMIGLDASDVAVPDLADWPALIDADDAARIEAGMGGANKQSARLTLTNFSGALASGDDVTGITVSVRAQITAGTGGATFDEVRMLLPNGSVSEDKSAATAASGTKTLHTFGGANDAWGLTLTPDLINAEGLGVRLRWKSGATGTYPVDVSVYEVILTAHTGTGAQTLRLYVDLSMVDGDRHRLRIQHDDLQSPGSEDSISVKWAGVAAAGDPIPSYRQTPGSDTALTADSVNKEDPSVVTQGVLEGAGEIEGEFIADGPVLGIEFYSQPGQTGEQRLTRISLDQISISVNRFKDLIRALVSDAGFDPDTDIVNAELDAVADATGNPPMGWYVKNQTRRLQLMTLFAQSLGAAVWGGIDGKIHAAMMALPAQPAGDYLEVGPERCMGPSTVIKDEGPDLRDRTHAAQNIDPLRPNETAGITETWPETERQKALADWRITERVSFDRLDDPGPEWPLP